jgi:hypothetical protein
VAELRRTAGSQLDPAVAGALLAVLERERARDPARAGDVAA